MARKNNKKLIVNYDNTIRKSNELSMAKLNQGLTLNQMQLLAYAIFSTQQNGSTEFRKYEFQNQFGIHQYRTENALEDSQKISLLQFSIQDLKNDKFSFTNVFSSIEYERGYFSFEWNKKMIPHILELKDKFVLTDLTITSKFSSGFSWVLYDYIKALYGYWHKELTKGELMKLFGVENMKSYQTNTSRFKQSVLDVAVQELNKHTELKIWYTEKKVGNKIIGFKLHWSTGVRETTATDKQLSLLREIYEEINKNTLDYISVKDVERARNLIININEIHLLTKKGLSVNQANEYIKKSLESYKELERIVEVDGKQRDKSIYYNWLEEVSE